MTEVRMIAIFVAAALAELGGAFAVWRWRRAGAPAVFVLVGLVALLAYAVVQTFSRRTGSAACTPPTPECS